MTILVFTDSTSCLLLFNGLPLKCQIKLKNDCYNFPHTKVWCFGFCLTVQNEKDDYFFTDYTKTSHLYSY